MNEELPERWPENPLGYQVAIQEMQFALQNNLASFDAVRNMARTLFGAASLIVGLLGTFQIVSAELVPDYRSLYNLLIGLTMFAYVGLIVCCLWVLKPVNIQLPTQVAWESLWNFYLSETDENIYKSRLISYIEAIHDNWPIIARLRKLTNLASGLLPVIILLILGISMLPRVP